ncbi:MAG: septum site-determining protein MinC [Acetobacteraceae bacterium]|nr:septum site-determining protein MinC [Acetobacteraceae bacterium]MBV8526650.1 septum site-determining protein MinC [Acetobacteraceae bacterium]
MTNITRPRSVVRVRGRSFMALVLRPESPVADWVAGLDAQIACSPSFFMGRPVVLDLSALTRGDPAIPALCEGLQRRNVRIVGVEGVDESPWPGAPVWAQPLVGGRLTGVLETREDPESETPAIVPGETSLLIDHPVRSGQSVVFPKGDLTIVGAVASGAEVVASGSVHVYGALRGRVVAGLGGNTRARIFCRRLEAELISIDGLYKTADDMDPALRGRAVQAWLQGEAMMMAALD